jgi:hypothetical protein
MGVKQSVTMNKIFVLLNTFIIGFVVIFGGSKADFHNWAITRADVIIKLYF